MKNNDLLGNLKIEEFKDERNKNKSSFVFSNLPSESAITLGNYYRRVMLSYMKGISIFGIEISNKIQQLETEFSVLEGLVETPPYLILNLKKVIFVEEKNNEDENDEKIFKLNIDIDNNSDDDYVVKSSDIFDLEKKIKVFDSDVYLATLAPHSSLKIDIYCKKNWGFRKHNFESIDFDEKQKSDYSDSEKLILVDSNYNPVLNVSYSIDFVVTGLEKQDEKLILKIETNGSLSPKEVIIKAFEISLDMNKIFFDNLKNISQEGKD